MEQTELIGISRRRLLAMSSVSAVATLLAGLGRFTSSGNAKASDLLSTTFRTNASFGPIKQIDSGLLNVGYTESGLAKGPPSHSPARLALRHLQLCRCCALIGGARLPSVRSLHARLWNDALSFERDVSQRSTSGNCLGYRRVAGYSQDRESNSRRF